MQLPQHKLLMQSTAQDEDAIAQAILKRAEIARITRQLKTKLLKAKNKTEITHKTTLQRSSSTVIPTISKIPLPRSASHQQLPQQHVLPTPPSSQIQITRKRSFEELYSNNTEPLIDFHDEYETDEYESPAKKSNNSNIPSSPLYSSMDIPTNNPQTPPRKHVSLSTESTTLLSMSSNTHSAINYDLLSTPKQKVINNLVLDTFKTPTSISSHRILFPNRTPINTLPTLDLSSSSKRKKNNNGDNSGQAAELLMFFANSPSPAPSPVAQPVRRTLPTTPKRLFTNINDSSFLNQTPPTSGNMNSNVLGSTPLGSSDHSRTIDFFGSGNRLPAPVTPGKKSSSFLLNDFVTSVFTPSPRR